MGNITGDIKSQRMGQLADEIRQNLGVHGFGVDTITYDWVKLFVKDRDARAEIGKLQGHIVEIRDLPVDKDELKASLKKNLAAFKVRRLAFLRENIKQAQCRQVGLLSRPTLFGPHNAWKALGEGASWVAFLDFNLTDQEIDSLFEGLEQGVTQPEKDKRITVARQEIAKLEETIEKKYSPKERWFFDSSGDRMPYPKGCRWTPFVKTWKEVVERYAGAVNIDGYLLETPEEHAAYGLLGLGEIAKKSPLREAVKRGGIQPETTKEPDEIREKGTQW